MSHKSTPIPTTAPPGALQAAVRRAMGHQPYNQVKLKRRMKCSNCPKTWRFQDKLLYTECPHCKKGRIS